MNEGPVDKAQVTDECRSRDSGSSEDETDRQTDRQSRHNKSWHLMSAAGTQGRDISIIM